MAAAHIAIRMNERIWIVGRRIMVRRERISRRQMFAISIVAGLTAGLGLILGASVKRSYEDQLQRRFRTKPR